MLEIPLSSLNTNGEQFLAGPPCQGFNESGTRLAEKDPRSMVMERVVEWVIFLAWHGNLLWFAIENSPNIERCYCRGVSYASMILDKLRVGVPFFVIESAVVKLMPVLPHDRTRWWARGLRDQPHSPSHSRDRSRSHTVTVKRTGTVTVTVKCLRLMSQLHRHCRSHGHHGRGHGHGYGLPRAPRDTVTHGRDHRHPGTLSLTVAITVAAAYVRSHLWQQTRSRPWSPTGPQGWDGIRLS